MAIRIADASVHVQRGTGGYPSVSVVSLVVANTSLAPALVTGTVVAQYSDGSQRRASIGPALVGARSRRGFTVEFPGVIVSAGIRVSRLLVRRDSDERTVYY